MAAWVTPSSASRSRAAWSATGSGVVRLPYSVPSAADHAERADAGRLVAGGGEDLAGEIGDRGLAAGAGDGDEMRRLARMEARRDQRQRAARIVGADDRHVGLDGGIPARQDRDGAPGNGVGDEAGAVGGRPGQRGKQEMPRRRRGCRRTRP